MRPIPYHIGPVDWEAIEQGRRQSPAERFLDSARLFDMACAVARSGIRRDHPDADETEINRLLAERVALDEAWGPQP
jgi:hypothetical protein